MSSTAGLAASRWALPNGADFFRDVAERLSAHQLDGDDTSCNICTIEYADLDVPSSDPELDNLFLLSALPFPIKRTSVDEPVRLPCGHIFGSDCLRTWLSTNISCPICRRDLIGAPWKLPPVCEEYSRRLSELRQRTLRHLMKPTWTADQIIFIPPITWSIEEHIQEFILQITAGVRRAEFDESFSREDDHLKAAMKEEAARFLKDRLTEGMPTEIPMDAPAYRQLQQMLTCDTREAYQLICERLQAMGGMEMSPAKLCEELLDIPSIRPSKDQDRTIELAVKAAVEYERLTCELDTVAADESMDCVEQERSW